MKTLLKTHDKNSIGLIGHVIVNYPSPAVCREAIKIMAEEGVDLIELQIPFSEPVADGPVFLAANQKAIEQGVTIKDCFELMAEVTKKYKIPFVFMTYANIPFRMGFANFVKKAKEAGASGAIIPELPLENSKEYFQACKENDFATPMLIPPNVSATRLPKLAKASSGFIYAVARAGVTGSKTEMGKELLEFVNKIRQSSKIPIAVGFGIAAPSDVEFLKPYADYAIVGSQALRVLEQQGLAGLRQFWQDLKKIC